MPRYFFHLISDGLVIVDEEGIPFSELSAAHRHGVKLQDQIRLYCSEPPCDWIVKVSDHTGATPLVILPSVASPSIVARELEAKMPQASFGRDVA